MSQKTSLRTSLLCARLRVADTLRNSRAVWRLSAAATLAKSFAVNTSEDRLQLRASAYRRSSPGVLRRQLESHLSAWLEPPRADIWRREKIGWQRFRTDLVTKALDRCIILKSPTDGGEKGVLYVSFEHNWLRLIEHYDLPKLMERYFVVVASSWSPPDFAVLWALANIGPDPIFLQISNQADMEMHQLFQHNIQALPIMASDWINPEFYRPRPQHERQIDILMVAGWSTLKRHWLLFRALRKMRRDLRVVLIGQNSEGRTADDVWHEAKAFGIADRIEIVRDVAIERVTSHQCNSKISVVLSAREGSSVVVAESFFADAPVAMMYNAHIGSRAYINSQTGVLIRPKTMAAQLSELVERSASYGPRAWAMANITCFHSTSKLNSPLREYCSERGMPWTRDIVPFCWRPDPIYVNDTDDSRMKSAYRDLYGRHGVVVAGRTPS
jgi:glycosyltransferase involved in cell wall biosynthesis